nr:7-alpha-hydroxycholest-4-en-3-one 12-alpha-hydroxylase-like [Pogona vitticeps]
MSFWEILLWTSLASLLTTLLGGLYAMGTFRARRPREPPLDKGFIPWLGYAINFKKDPVQFLQRMRKKHGDVFTVLVGGNYLHFVMDPHTYRHIVKEPKNKLDFYMFASVIVFNAFGFHSSECHHKIVQTFSNKYLSGQNLSTLNQVMMANLQKVLFHRQEQKRSWQQDGVLHFSYRNMFQAAYLTLFGTEPEGGVEKKDALKENELTHYGEMFEAFQRFDRFFPQMAFSLLDPLGKRETQRLKNIFWDILSLEKVYQKDNISSWVLEQDKRMAEVGMTEKVRTRFLFLLLWASQANTGPATFWILVHLLKHPEAMEAVREEVDEALREAGQEVKPGCPIGNVTLSALKTPFLESAIEETLRLKTSPFLFRSVMQDTDIKTSDGREYTLRKGDHLLLFPFLALHMDPEIYPDPHVFKYDRFISPNGTKKEFYKDGIKLKHSTMPFGAGPSMCPGRFFAMSEMKIFVILMLTYFDMELVKKEEEIPAIDARRYGFGTAHPSHDIQFRYRLRF